MKLHVGCGPKKLEGYKHQDVVAFPHVDYCCPAWEVPVADGTFEEIYSRHLFEHFYPWEADDVLREWHRILTDDGKIVMLLPDLAYHAKQLFLDGPCPVNPITSNYDHAMAGFYGWVKKEKPYMAHHWGYTSRTICQKIAPYFYDIEIHREHEWEIHLEARGKK